MGGQGMGGQQGGMTTGGGMGGQGMGGGMGGGAQPSTSLVSPPAAYACTDRMPIGLPVSPAAMLPCHCGTSFAALHDTLPLLMIANRMSSPNSLTLSAVSCCRHAEAAGELREEDALHSRPRRI